MSLAVNYEDALLQLRDAGLQVEVIEIGRLIRCRVEGEREKCGWYAAHEVRFDNGDMVIVGSFGVWRGNEKNARRIDLKRREISAEQKSAITARIAEDRRRAEAMRKGIASRAAARAGNAWRRYTDTWTPPGGIPTASNLYLLKKSVRAHGVRFTSAGNLVVPITDIDGRIHGLQIIYHVDSVKKCNGRVIKEVVAGAKDYWPVGLVKSGHLHLIGGAPTWVVLVAEGYATAASLHEATGLPVAVAFDANNLQPVAAVLHKRYRDVKILICADDDFATWQNPGIRCASAAALAVGGEWLAPRFAEDPLRAAVAAALVANPPASQDEQKALITPLITGRQKRTDFNDLHIAEGLHLVRTQIEAKLQQLEWTAAARAAPTHNLGESGSDRLAFGGDRLLQGYVLIYPTETVFDEVNGRIVHLGPLRAAAGKSNVRSWLEHPNRRIVTPEQVGFDPTGKNTTIVCNLWRGWPTTPKAGACERLLELLEYLCGNEDNPRDLSNWILKWLAYPIQNPGAKMQTALLIHGPEGTGKNIFFSVVRRIHGPHGGNIGQTELESQFNGWASAMTFMICNEVVSRVELYHQQGRLKNMITETEWHVNEKNLPARMEANHCNFVFFSNRIDIAKLDPRDRRYCVVWTPAPVAEEFYREVADEIAAGGVAALHDYLLNLDLGDFNAHTKPPITRAKRDLIEIGMDSTERFVRDWFAGDLDVPCCPVLSRDLYRAYVAWAKAEGVPKAAQQCTLTGVVGKKHGVKAGPFNHYTSCSYSPIDRTKSRMIIPPESVIAPHLRHDGIKEQAKWLTDTIMAFKSALDQERSAP